MILKNSIFISLSFCFFVHGALIPTTDITGIISIANDDTSVLTIGNDTSGNAINIFSSSQNAFIITGASFKITTTTLPAPQTGTTICAIDNNGNMVPYTPGGDCTPCDIQVVTETFTAPGISAVQDPDFAHRHIVTIGNNQDSITVSADTLNIISEDPILGAYIGEWNINTSGAGTTEDTVRFLNQNGSTQIIVHNLFLKKVLTGPHYLAIDQNGTVVAGEQSGTTLSLASLTVSQLFNSPGLYLRHALGPLPIMLYIGTNQTVNPVTIDSITIGSENITSIGNLTSPPAQQIIQLNGNAVTFDAQSLSLALDTIAVPFPGTIASWAMASGPGFAGRGTGEGFSNFGSNYTQGLPWGIYIDTSNNVVIQLQSLSPLAPHIQVKSQDIATAGGSLVIGSNNILTTEAPSSERLKKNIVTLAIEKEDFQKLAPKMFNYIKDNKKDFGLIAEDLLETPFAFCIIYDQNNEVYSIDYRPLFIATLQQYQACQKEFNEYAIAYEQEYNNQYNDLISALQELYNMLELFD